MKITKFEVNILSPETFQGEFDNKSLVLMCGENGVGKTLLNKINYFQSYILACLPDLIQTQIFKTLTSKSSDLDFDVNEIKDFTLSIHEDLNSIDVNYIDLLFNACIIPDVFEENNLTGSFSLIYENQKEYRDQLVGLDNAISANNIPEIPDGMTLSDEEIAEIDMKKVEMHNLIKAKEHVVKLSSGIDKIKGMVIKFNVKNNKFQGFEIEFDTEDELAENPIEMAYFDLKLSTIMLFGKSEFPKYLTTTCRSFGNYNKFMKLVPEAKRKALETTRKESDDFAALKNYWVGQLQSELAKETQEGKERAAHIKQTIDTLQYFFDTSLNFFNKKEFQEELLKQDYTIMDAEIFLEINSC